MGKQVLYPPGTLIVLAAAEPEPAGGKQALSTLVNKSLLQCKPSGRYTIHELLRQYAEAELEAAKQSEYTPAMLIARTIEAV
jgi:hypothetical protein